MLNATGERYLGHRTGPDAWEFFYHNAGWSYAPGKQSEVVGRMLGAVDLARAEAHLYHNDATMYVVWEEDPYGAECVMEDGVTYETLPAVGAMLYVTCVYCPESNDAQSDIEHCERKAHCHISASLWGITESSDYRERNDYRRVIEATLASEAIV